MPIAAALPIMIPMLREAYSLKEKAKPKLIAKKLTDAIATGCVLGMLPAGPAMIPLIPVGKTIAATIIEQAFSFPLPIPDVIALMLAAGIALVSPMCPPSGLSSLQSSMKEVLNLGPNATPDQMAMKTAQAVITYYQTGGII